MAQILRGRSDGSTQEEKTKWERAFPSRNKAREEEYPSKKVYQGKMQSRLE